MFQKRQDGNIELWGRGNYQKLEDVILFCLVPKLKYHLWEFYDHGSCTDSLQHIGLEILRPFKEIHISANWLRNRSF